MDVEELREHDGKYINYVPVGRNPESEGSSSGFVHDGHLYVVVDFPLAPYDGDARISVRRFDADTITKIQPDITSQESALCELVRKAVTGGDRKVNIPISIVPIPSF